MSDELPKGWASTRLEEIVTKKKGKKPAILRDTPAEGYVPYLDIHAIEKNVVREYAEVKSSKIASKDDLFVVWDGARSGWVGGGITGAIGSTIMALTAQTVESAYVRQFIASQFKNLNTNTRGTGIPHVDPEVFWNLEVPLAPLAEQRRIVAKLEKLLGQVDACQQRLETMPTLLKRFRQSTLAAACSGRLTADWRDGDDGPDDLPRTWELVEFGSLIAKGPNNGLYKPQSCYGSGTPIVRIDAFYDGKISNWLELKRLQLSKQEREQFALAEGDILINRVNSPKFLGKCAIVRAMPEPSVYESNMMRLQLDTARANSDYAILYLRSSQGLEELRKNAKHAVNQSSINQDDVKFVMFALPPLAEQQEIVRRVAGLFALADQLEQRLAQARQQVDKLTPSLLARAFAGKLVPQDPKDEPAEKLLNRK